MNKLLVFRVITVSFIVTCIVSGYEIQNDADFFIFFGGILIGIAYLIAEIINLEQFKKL